MMRSALLSLLSAGFRQAQLQEQLLRVVDLVKVEWTWQHRYCVLELTIIRASGSAGRTLLELRKRSKLGNSKILQFLTSALRAHHHS